MKVFITSAYLYHEKDNYTPCYLSESANNDLFRVHELVDNPAEADIIIFAEHHPDADPYFFGVLRNDIYKKYKSKCYLYHDHDNTIALIPYITPSLSQKHSDPIFNQPFSYIVQLSPNNVIREYAAVEKKKFLFSFMGTSRTHPVRKEIFAITYDRCYLLDTLNKNSWELSNETKADYQKSYAKACFQSKFILCPRGNGPNSYRLYESMEMGIAPVIISDDWVPTAGPKWEEFSIRVAESDVKKIPEILEKCEADSERMGELARQAWVEWFAKDKQFHYLAEACLKLHAARHQVNHATYLAQYLRFLEPFHARNLLRFYKNRLVEK